MDVDEIAFTRVSESPKLLETNKTLASAYVDEAAEVDAMLEVVMAVIICVVC